MLSFHHSPKHEFPSLSPPNPGKMPIRVNALAFDLFVLNRCSEISQPTYPIVPSPVNIREKRVTASLIVELVKLVSGLELLICEILANPAAVADVLVLNVHKTPS
jgi:hypothetical protein